MSVTNFLTFADRIPLAVFGFNPRTNELIYVNTPFRELFRIAPNIDGGAVWARIPKEDREYLKQKLEELLKGTPVKDIEVRVALEEQQTSWLRLTALMIADQDEKLVAGYALDVTAEVNNLDTYKKYANKKNSILHILAHDLSGYLAIAHTATELLNRSTHDPGMRDLIDTVSKITKQSVTLIKDLTRREFLETADVELVKERVDIVQKLRDYMEETQRSEPLTRRNFSFTSSHDHIFIRLDEAKFFQIVNNLVSNALKFTHENGNISVHAEDRDTSVVFSFTDDGVGIPQEMHKTLFEQFTSARRAGLRGEPSGGLGLSIVKTIIDWHQGKIWLDTKKTAGTTFYIEIPKS